MIDARRFPLRPDKPHIFRASGWWRVSLERFNAMLQWEYVEKANAAHEYARKLQGIPS